MKILFAYRYYFAFVVIAAAVAGTNYVRSALRPNNAVSIWFDEKDSVLQSYHEFQNRFGNDRILVLALKRDNGILQPEELKKTETLTRRLSEIDGVKEVQSLINAGDFRKIKINDTTRIRYVSWFYNNPHYEITPQLKEELLTSPLLVNRVINKSGTVALLFIHFLPLQQMEERIGEIIARVESAAVEIAGADKFHLSGTDMITYGLNSLSKRDFTLFTLLAFGLIFLITGFFYRRPAYMFLVFLVSFLAIWISLALHGWLGYRLNIFTVICPPLIVTIGVISLIHIINEYEYLLLKNSGTDTTLLARQALSGILKPCVYTTLTTIIGFASLFTSATAVLREFALLSSTGILLVFVFSVLFSGIILPYQKKARETKKVGQALDFFSFHILRHPVKYSVFSAATVVVFLLGMRLISNDMNPLKFFPENHPVVKSHEFMLQNWGDYYPMDFVLTAAGEKKLNDPQSIRDFLNFRDKLVHHPLVKTCFDYTVLMQRYCRVVFRKDLATVLEDPLLAGRFTEEFMSQLKDKAAAILSSDFTQARITITGPLLSIRALEQSLKTVDSLADRHFRDRMSFTIIGYPALYIRIMNHAFNTMQSSLYSCFILIFIALLVFLRSLRMAIIAIIPNIFPVIILLGFLGWSGINLDLATCTVAAIVIGIAVDDTIFFMHHYRKAKSAGATLQDNISKTHLHAGRAILLSSLILLAGFSIMLFASLKIVFYFGLLAIVSVLSAAAGDLVVLPVLIHFFDRKRKRDAAND